jgi:hypothetical protein
MLKNILRKLILARQRKADLEIARILQQLDYRREQTSYIESKLHNKELP